MTDLPGMMLCESAESEQTAMMQAAKTHAHALQDGRRRGKPRNIWLKRGIFTRGNAPDDGNDAE